MPLPDAFAKIPEDDASADVRASVPGTLEARRATLEATLPEKKQVKAGAAPDVKVAYAGEPKFEPIADTGVKRAVNTGNDIIQYGDKYYLCYEGMWYVADKPVGPVGRDCRGARGDLPDPAELAVVSGHAGDRADDGQRRRPVELQRRVRGRHVHRLRRRLLRHRLLLPAVLLRRLLLPVRRLVRPRQLVQPQHRPATARAPSYYGPYGGYSYNQGYNPKTGRSSYVETAWDGDEWASSGGKLQPAHRHLDRDGSVLLRRLEQDEDGAHDRGAARQRDGNRATTDFDTGTSTTTRKTDAGGKSEVTRQRNADGSISTSGNVRNRRRQVGDDRGRSSGRPGLDDDHGRGRRHRDDEPPGQRQRQRLARGRFSKDGQTVDTETRRQGVQQRHQGRRQRRRPGHFRVRRPSAIARRSRRAAAATSTPATTARSTARRTTAGSSTATADGRTSTRRTGRTEASAGTTGRSRECRRRRPRYGGSGSLESRDTAGTRDAAASAGRTWAARAAQAPGSSAARTVRSRRAATMAQLNRDAAARSGGYQNYQRRARRARHVARRAARVAAATLKEQLNRGDVMKKSIVGGLAALMWLVIPLAIAAEILGQLGRPGRDQAEAARCGFPAAGRGFQQVHEAHARSGRGRVQERLGGKTTTAMRQRFHSD